MSGLPTYDTLEIARDGDVVTVTLARPEALNTMNLVMRDELGECFSWLRRSDARVVILTGAGDAFCAGGDANDFTELDSAELHELMRDRSHVWFRRLWQLPQPVIAAVNGVAAGGGANLMLGADFAVASERARFGETFIRLGLIPDLGGAFLLPRIVGLRRAKALSLSGRVLDASEARDWGLVDEVVVPDELLPRAREIAEDLCKRPPAALAAIKSMMNRSFERSMDETLESELYVQSFIFGTDDFREAVGDFLDGGERSRRTGG